jgi:hypothetical protein
MLASSVLLLTGCQEGGKLASFQPGDAPPSAAPPSICDAFLQPVKVTQETHKSNAQAAYTRAADERDEANDRLTVGGFCVRDERQAYAGKEKPR